MKYAPQFLSYFGAYLFASHLRKSALVRLDQSSANRFNLASFPDEIIHGLAVVFVIAFDAHLLIESLGVRAGK